MGFVGMRPLALRLLDPKKTEVTEEGCLRSLRLTSEGYAQIEVPAYANGGKRRRMRAHRLAWELAVGPVPEGLILDHICHDPALCKGGKKCPHRACIRVEHLQLATRKENLARERSSRWGADL